MALNRNNNRNILEKINIHLSMFRGDENGDSFNDITVEKILFILK